MSKLFVENTFIVFNRETGRKYECFEQMVDLGCNGKFVHRYNIGVNNYVNWYPVEMIYSEDEFDERYAVDLNSYAKYVEQEAWFAKELVKRNEE